MTLRQLLLIIRTRFWLIAGMLAATVVAATAVSFLLPKQYVATSAVVVDVKSPDPVAGMYLPALTMPAYMATQVDVVNSARVAQKVVKLLNLENDQKTQAAWQKATEGKGSIESWIAASLKLGLEIKPARESNVINISFKANDPGRAAAVANAFARAYIDTTVELRVEPAREYARWFEEQGKVLRNNLEAAQNRLAEYQQRKGIVSSDERLDYETAKLNELSTQLTLVQTQLVDASSKARAGGALPEVAQNSLVMNLRADVARLEAKLQDSAGNFGKNHPQYQRMEAELVELKSRLAAETRYVASGLAATQAASRGKETELRAAIEKQRQRVLEIKRERGELGVLQRDVEAAQKAFDAVSQRFNQASLESQSRQTNVAVLTNASEPTSPTSPKVLINIVASIVLGALLGLAAAIGLEFLDRRVRSPDDLADLLDLPLLGAIPHAQSGVSSEMRRLPGWSRPLLAR